MRPRRESALQAIQAVSHQPKPPHNIYSACHFGGIHFPLNLEKLQYVPHDFLANSFHPYMFAVFIFIDTVDYFICITCINIGIIRKIIRQHDVTLRTPSLFQRHSYRNFFSRRGTHALPDTARQLDQLPPFLQTSRLTATTSNRRH